MATKKAKSARQTSRASNAKKSPKKRAKTTAAKKSAARKRAVKKSEKNSLVANINARRKKGKSRPKSRTTISKTAYHDMENNWGKK